MKKEGHMNKKERMELRSLLKPRVIKILRFDDMDHSKFQYQQGIAYLKAYLNNDTYSVEVMERSRLYWNWWKSHWANRDQAFIEFVNNTAYDLETRREIYRDMHCGKTLAASIYPNGIVMNESYAVMVTELVEKETQRV